MYLSYSLDRFFNLFKLDINQIIHIKTSKIYLQSLGLIPIDSITNDQPRVHNLSKISSICNKKTLKLKGNLQLEVFNESDFVSRTNTSIDYYFIHISAILFCKFILNQLKSSVKFKDRAFSKGFIVGLTMVLRRYIL